jgi:hypothetical protein
VRDFALPFVGSGSFSIEPPAASSPVMSAVAPITTEFYAPQRTAVSADFVAKVPKCQATIFSKTKKLN